MPPLRLIFLIAAVVLFGVAALVPPNAPPRPNLVALGLLCLTVAFLVGG